MSLQTFTEGNKIIVPIEIRLSDLDKIQEAVGILKETQEGISEGGGGKEGGAPGGLDVADITQMAAMAKNPAGALLRAVQSNPYVAAALAAIFAGYMGYEWMTERGRPWSLYFKRVLSKENNIGRSRDSRQAVLAGFEQTIFVHESGEANVEYAFNSYNEVNSKEIKDMQIYHIRTGAPP